MFGFEGAAELTACFEFPVGNSADTSIEVDSGGDEVGVVVSGIVVADQGVLGTF